MSTTCTTDTPRPFLQRLFFALIVRPLVLLVLGLHVEGRERLPRRGPAVIVANHNSHLDTLILMSLYPLKSLCRVRPVAAADYFLSRRWLASFALRVMGIIPIPRRPVRGEDPLAGPAAALERGDILILYPEGTRGEPERLSRFKGGVARLAERFPHVPFHPVFIHGAGKALPKGEALLVPFFCDVLVGEPMFWNGSRRAFLEALEAQMHALAASGGFPPWA